MRAPAHDDPRPKDAVRIMAAAPTQSSTCSCPPQGILGEDKRSRPRRQAVQWASQVDVHHYIGMKTNGTGRKTSQPFPFLHFITENKSGIKKVRNENGNGIYMYAETNGSQNLNG